jgi:glycosyltransferase involved in cell wall biosynthesis
MLNWPAADPFRVGFVVKRYPRYSETFIVREILAHERAGVEIEIFALRPANDKYFQDVLARVRAPVNYMYLPPEGLNLEETASASLTAANFWRALAAAGKTLPGLWASLADGQHEEVRQVYTAILLACEVRRKGLHHLHAAFAHEAATVARLAAHWAGISFSFTARAKDIFHESVQPDDLRLKLRDAVGVVTVSDYHLRYLRQTYGPLAAHVQHIYNGLDLDEFPFRSPQERSPLILAIGRLVAKKGFADLVEACTLLARRGVAFRCRIIGAGPLLHELEEHIARAGLAAQVELVGPRPQGEVIEEMRHAALLAMPCIVTPDGDRDGLPNVIQEAMALGTPVISTDVTGIPEVVRDGETGLQVPQHDPAALAAAIERLLADSALRVQLANGARHLIEKEFDIHRNTEKRRAIFGRTASPRGFEEHAAGGSREEAEALPAGVGSVAEFDGCGSPM